MLQALLIGNIGANAQVKVSDGQEFVTFRVAHNEAYTKQDRGRLKLRSEKPLKAEKGK